MIEAKLLDLLVCPVTKGKLVYDRQRECLVSRQAKLLFPIVDGIPNLCLNLAQPIDESATADEDKS